MIDMYQNLVDNTSSSQEKKPFFSLHHVPKQIADSCNGVGLNERAIKEGLPSGVLKPSQKAHDRLISIRDAIWDSLNYTIVALLFSYAINWFTISLVVLQLLYISFHIDWWEKGKQWEFVNTIEEYLTMTRNYYYGFLSASCIVVPTGIVYIMKYYGIDAKISYFLNLFNDLWTKINSFKSGINIETSTVLSGNVNEFETDYENTISTTNNFFNNVNIEETAIEKLASAPSEIFMRIDYFVIVFLVCVIVNIVSINILSKYYNKKEKININAKNKELKHDMENIFEDLGKL